MHKQTKPASALLVEVITLCKQSLILVCLLAAAMKERCPPEDSKSGESRLWCWRTSVSNQGYVVTLSEKTLAETDDDSWSDVMSSYPSQPIHLWQFLRELLLKPHNYSRCIRWLNKEKGEAKLSLDQNTESLLFWFRHANMKESIQFNYPRFGVSCQHAGSGCGGIAGSSWC